MRPYLLLMLFCYTLIVVSELMYSDTKVVALICKDRQGKTIFVGKMKNTIFIDTFKNCNARSMSISEYRKQKNRLHHDR